MDRSVNVFNIILKLDNLDHSAQFSTSLGAQEKIIKNWRLEEGFHSFLLDGQGSIIAVDPNEQDLASIK